MNVVVGKDQWHKSKWLIITVEQFDVFVSSDPMPLRQCTRATSTSHEKQTKKTTSTCMSPTGL